jgi:hypothetical protein
MYSAICIFAYNRPFHLERTLNALAQNYQASESEIYIFIDGPKGEHDELSVRKSIKLAEEVDSFKNKHVIASEKNKGLAESIKNGINQVFETHSKVIVLEDDILTKKSFLRYMNAALDKYENYEDVASVQSFSVATGIYKQYFFLPGADCWGWGTWRDRWVNVNWDSKELLKEIVLSGSERKFNFNNSYNFSSLLSLQSKSKIDSWAICWQASTFLRNMKSIYPPINLSSNIGFDQFATHTKAKGYVFPSVENCHLNLDFPDDVSVNSEIFETVCNLYFQSSKNLIFLRRFVRMLRNSLPFLSYRSFQAKRW